MNKKNKCIAGILSMALVATLAGGTILGVSANQRNQSKVTGQSVSTINEYEATGVSTYIGQGYDVISKGYVNAGDVEKTNHIFNVKDTKTGKGIRNTDIIVDSGSNKYQDYQESSKRKSDFIINYNSSLGFNVGGEASSDSEMSLDGLFAKAFTKITPSITGSLSVSGNYSDKQESLYKKNIREMDTEYVTWILDDEEYYDYLTDSFKKDVVSMNSKELFAKYGTHFLKSVKLGGRLDITYALSSDNKENFNKVATNLELQVNGIFNTLEKYSEEKSTDENSEGEKTEEYLSEQSDNTSNNSVNLTNDIDVKRVIEDVDANIYVSCYGGINSGFASLAQDNTIVMNSGCADWLRQVPNKPALIGVLDENSLVPIWTLLDGMYANGDITEEVYNARKTELEEAFTKYGEDNFNRIVNSDISKEMSTVKPIEVETKAVAVMKDTNFNKKYTLKDNIQALHEGSQLGTIILVNAKDNGESYSTTNKGLKIRFRLDQDAKKLSSGTSKLRNHKLVSSTCMGTVDGYGKVFGTKLLGLGKGAYYVQVTYNDQTTEKITGTNVLKGVNKNDTITLLDSANLAVDQHDGIDKVSVVFLHSTMADNVIGLNYGQDWISENVFNFD